MHAQGASVGADMTLRVLSLIAVLASGFAASAEAQSGPPATPANFPPDSYTGKQFVDNRGCVFVRAGFDGNVTWVPRVSRQRKQICGQTPTFAAAAPAPVPAPVPRQAEPVQITTTPPAAAPAPDPAPARRVARQAAPKPQPQPRRSTRTPASKPVQIAPPRVVVRRAPAQATDPRRYKAGQAVRVPAQIACQNGQTTRVVDGRTLTMRCGPQKTPHVTIIRRGEAPAPGKNVYYNRKSWDDSRLDLPGRTRIVPRHVYEERDTQIAHVPAGYRPAWDDDRLNRQRAVMSVDGFHATQQVWTNTVPRRLVVQSRNHRVKDPIIAYRATGAYPVAQAHAPVISSKGAGTPVVSTPVISTRTEAPAGPKQAAKDRWVEIGSFSTRAKADAAASRLIAAGLPVRMATVDHAGRTMRKLRVGPYTSPGALNAALGRVHGAGYVQARIR